MSRRLMPQSVTVVALAELLRTIADQIEQGRCGGGHLQWMPTPPTEDPDDPEDLAQSDCLLVRGVWRIDSEVVVVGHSLRPFGRPVDNTAPL